MPLGTDHVTATDAAVFIPEIWQSRINDFFKANLVMRPLVLDFSDSVSMGGDTINIPGLTEMAANAKVNASQVTLNSPTEAQVQLVVDTWEEVSFLIEDREKAQILNSYSLQERYAQNAGYTLARSVDSALLGLYAGLSQNVGDFVSDIDDQNVRDAMEALDVNDVPAEDRFLVIRPEQHWALLGIDKFVAMTVGAGADPASITTSNSPVFSGMLGMLYGVPVFKTTQVVLTTGDTEAHNLLFQREAFAMAIQNEIRLQTNYIPEYLGELTTADVLYGVIENRDAAAVEVRSQV